MSFDKLKSTVIELQTASNGWIPTDKVITLATSIKTQFDAIKPNLTKDQALSLLDELTKPINFQRWSVLHQCDASIKQGAQTRIDESIYRINTNCTR